MSWRRCLRVLEEGNQTVIYLVLSVVLSTALFVAFKLFHRFGIEVFPAIWINYATCFIAGNIYGGPDHILKPEVVQAPGFWWIFGMGSVFVATFFLMGSATQRSGTALSSMASKMSVVIPVMIAVLAYRENISWWQVGGIALSLLSVFFISEGKEGVGRFDWMLVGVFIGSGIVDSGLNALKQSHFSAFTDISMSTLLFAGAFTSGTIMVAFRPSLIKSLSLKTMVGGMALGLANYGSLIAMFAAIEAYSGKTSLFFTLNNVGVVLLSTVVGFLFKEKLTKEGWMGLVLAVIAIFLLK